MGQVGHFQVPKTHLQNEVKFKTFLVKMSFICMRIKQHFHINGFALSLALKQTWGYQEITYLIDELFSC